MKVCAVICRKAKVALPDANYLSSRCQSQSPRAQNRGFCALLGSGTLVFGLFEHKIEVFMRFCPSEPPFSGILSTKTAFLCQKRRYFPGFGSSRAQKRHFCALLPFKTLVFSPFEHKIGVFVRFCPQKPSFSGLSSTKMTFLCSGRRGLASGRITMVFLQITAHAYKMQTPHNQIINF